jgi:hypothetical protein
VVSVGPQIGITALSQGPTRSPNAVRLRHGNIVFVWQGNPAGGEDQPHMRIFKPDWAPLTAVKRVNSSPDYRGWDPEVVALSDGGFAVVWEARSPSSSEKQKVKARFFDRLGNPLPGGEITVAGNMYRRRDCRDTDGERCISGDMAGLYGLLRRSKQLR